MLKKLLAVLLAACMLFVGFAFAEEDEVEHAPVAILYTNDAHCAIDENVGYAGIVGYRNAYEELGYDTLLVDNGDAVQGDAVGTLSKGEYLVDIMNEAGYDLAIPGNHEFDYGMDRFMELVDMADYTYLSANFCDADGDPIFDAYVIEDLGGWEVAFVGVSTPETFTKSTPTYFQDEEGNYIYNFCEGNDGQNLYDAVQNAVDAARAEGADFVIVMSHLGTDGTSSPYTSSDVIVNTTGIDAVLDGHSHSVWEQEIVSNADGEDVILSSTGTKLQNLGILIIDTDGTISTTLHREYIVLKDYDMVEYIDSIKAEYEDTLNEVVASTDVALTINDPEATAEDGSPLRIVRSQETNLGDLCADAYRVMTGADIGFANGGGIRASIATGDITNGDIMSVQPYGNMVCMVETTGQDILDALEVGARGLPDENGGFLQVSGLTYEINVSVPSTVVMDEQGSFIEITGDRRVANVLVNGEPIDPEGTYTVASHNYMLKEGGDGINMFMDDTLLLDEILIDNQMLINYIVDELGGVVGEEYADPYGQGRIVIHE